MTSAPSDVASRRVVVATHGHCFDGMCSAVMFTRLLRHVHPGTTFDFEYYAAGYGPGQNGVDPSVLSGDENAILDFRFSRSPKLTWYFDHHVSAFPTPEDRAVFDARVVAEAAKGAVQTFHDGAYGSCTKLIADLGAARFDLDVGPMAETVRWADIIDTAGFPNAEMAVERKEPELALMTVVEHAGNDAFLARYVPRLLAEPLSEVARSSEIVEMYGPLKATHEAFVGQVKRNAVTVGPVVFVDLTSEVIEVAGKFVTYALYPKSVYSVVLTRSKTKFKISVGYNPWCGTPRRHDIAKICERYGGGGHAVVGAVSLAANDAEPARAAALEIVKELGT